MLSTLHRHPLGISAGWQTDRQAPLLLEVKPSRTSTNQKDYVWAVVVFCKVVRNTSLRAKGRAI
jgi:hypothetical protein